MDTNWLSQIIAKVPNGTAVEIWPGTCVPNRAFLCNGTLGPVLLLTEDENPDGDVAVAHEVLL